MRILLLVILLGIGKSVNACHGMALVSPSITTNSTSIGVTDNILLNRLRVQNVPCNVLWSINREVIWQVDYI